MPLSASGADRGPVSLCLSPRPGTDAVEPCRAASRLDLPPVRARNVRVALARALAAGAAYSEAVDAYREVARLAPEDAHARRQLAEALLHLQGDAQAAAEEAQQALRLDPLSARAYGLLGAALHAMGQHPEAAAAFGEAVRLDPAFFESRPAARDMDAASRRGTAWPPAADQPASSGS